LPANESSHVDSKLGLWRPENGKQKICFDEMKGKKVDCEQKLLLSVIRRVSCWKTIENDDGEAMFGGMGAHGVKLLINFWVGMHWLHCHCKNCNEKLTFSFISLRTHSPSHR
jgi:hypothetical protein